jgi:2-keto-4-pentenoate hydratase/2-oxohepta-3-ene-1,7-dioic acid hydratase in catechol pathway
MLFGYSFAPVRYLTFSTHANPTPRLGVVHRDRIVEVPQIATLLELIQQGPAAWTRVQTLFASTDASTGHELTDIRWHAPIPRPLKNIFCVGRNYAAHAQESARARGTEVKIPDAPMFFTKAPTTVVGPHDDIPCDWSISTQIDWEAELAVIVGVKGRNIPRAGALAHVFGYTVLNDVTARDLQKQHVQFFKGKSLDAFCPMGPLVVTVDEFGDPQARQVTLRVNGVEKQNGRTSDMIFPVDALIETLSAGMTLEPGDILATGTPEGVGFARTPPEFLRDGDVMETEVEGIGTLRNRIVSI